MVQVYFCPVEYLLPREENGAEDGEAVEDEAGEEIAGRGHGDGREKQNMGKRKERKVRERIYLTWRGRKEEKMDEMRIPQVEFLAKKSSKRGR